MNLVKIPRRLIVGTLALGLLFAAGCGSDSSNSSGENSTSEATAEPAPAEADGDYAFGSGRGDIAKAIDEAFKSQGGKSSWEGDTLVLKVEGDSAATMAGFTQCRVLVELLNENDNAVIEFPNGRVACAEVLNND